jgi:superfamily II RNA helicase
MQRLNSLEEKNSDIILELFLDYVKELQLELFPAQEEAILELYSGNNVILNTPTGSGKSMVATALHFYSIAFGRRSVYTCPIKALVNEKFLYLCRVFGPDQVGMITGDATVNPGAPIICCTAEILANYSLRQGSSLPFEDVIMDEFHYYSDKDRGIAWQTPLLILSHARFLLMSATLGETDSFEKALTHLNRLHTSLVSSSFRPVPLKFQYSEIPLHEQVTRLIEAGLAPVYIVNFSQRECAEVAQNFLSIDFSSKEEKKRIIVELENTLFSSPYGKEFQKLLKHGIGIHHAGLLPKYRLLVEKLAQKGLLKIICGTDTLGVGVNVPIRTVVFTKLCKFDGEKTSILTVRDFLQISGRAGRKGFDNEGNVVIQAPEHVIENIRQEQKAAGDPKKLKKLVKKKQPDKGFVNWNKETFIKLSTGKPETLLSRFKVSHAMVLSVLSRSNENGCRAMQKLIRDCHEPESSKKHHRKVAFQMFRSLVEREIVQLKPLRVNVDLQEDFSLNHTLSLYLLDTIPLLPVDHPDFALNVLSLVESILDNPEAILNKQLDSLKRVKLEELKLQGVEYDDRIAELEKLEYPKPLRDFIYETFNIFSKQHPWIGQENIRPKSIAREMYEKFQSFPEYIREYGLQRSEGVLLRYLSDVYKVLIQTVPNGIKDERTIEIITYLDSIVRRIDSSLLDEWEKLQVPNVSKHELSAGDSDLAHQGSCFEQDITSDHKKFVILIRNEIFLFIRALSAGDYESAISTLSYRDEVEKWTEDSIKIILKEYYDDGHLRICTDTRARHPQFTDVKAHKESKVWTIEQTLVDSEGHNDWGAYFTVDLEISKQRKKPALFLNALKSF